MSHPSLADHVAAVRRFNRFYTRRIGILDRRHLGTPFSLAEVRVLYELAHRDNPTAGELVQSLGLDAGYLSRLIQGFRKRGLVERSVSPADGRRQHLALTEAGRHAFATINSTAEGEIVSLLSALTPDRQTRLTDSMRRIEDLLEGNQPAAVPYLIRPPHAGDLGWVIERHGALYAEEYGWDQRFEGLVAEIVAQFIANLDPGKERCWIAEREGRRVGSVFLVKASVEVAKLRLLLVEPEARGLGIGQRLVAECIRFARHTGYRRMTLWTNDVLAAARHIYQAAGFQLVQEESHSSFGKDLVSQVWELELFKEPNQGIE